MSSCALWDRYLLCFERIIFEIIMEHLEYGLAQNSKGLTSLYQMDIDFQYWSLKAQEHDVSNHHRWPSFWLAHTLLPLLTFGPLLALWTSHEHHSIFFLISLLTFYTGIRVFWCIYILFESFMSCGLIGSPSSLFFCLPNISLHHTSLFISFVSFFIFFHHIFLCPEWWFFTFWCREDGHIPFHSYLMDISSKILNLEGYLVRESSLTSLFESISISLCILREVHLLIFRVCASKRKKMKTKMKKMKKKMKKKK